MANFLEFLKSGKSAKEFIDDAVLPQHVKAVARVGPSPKSYNEEKVGEEITTDSSDIPTVQPDDLSGVEADDKAHDIMDTAVLTESDENPDVGYIRQLEAFEKSVMEGEIPND